MLSQCICYTSETYQILSPVLFQQSLYFLLLIHRMFYLLVSALFLHALQYIRREHSSRSFAPPKKWLFASARARIRTRTPGRVRVRRRSASYSSCIILVCTAERVVVLKTKGLGTGATFMRGSCLAEPRLLAWLRERTVLVKSEPELHHW